MTNVSDVLTPVEAFPDEVDSRKRQWLQAFHPPVEQMNTPQVQEPASPESIVADFIRQHSASGQLVARSVFLLPPYSVPETDLSALLDVLGQDANGADITCVQGAEEAYFYSTQTMTANYADMCVQVVENDICRAIAEAVRFDCRTYPRPYKVAMLTQPPYRFESQQIAAALTAMETHPDYADIRTVESSNAEPYLFSERFMSYGKAYGLCEWLEVEQYQNP
ncbi:MULTISPECIES: YdhW family putative oxidoreductase system protein [Citrobacter]|uniref:YdhW family putative oxidoreductase system protein n=1 Tax=Citrobacter braakii TaxID=57706 RepID=A0A8I0KRX5_CITBR|nr:MULTISPECIES: YdhW family putative oxidoreductase system protein [Citrobacter]MBA7793929.1 YdhW family putative oxidoreductase system protein [Citrobacter sp. RHBSTW-01065]MBD3123082.1 YdhW family putative oxidoreductase system protein [Citrobacter braakii]MDM3386393.1 YdhW family putative oxidoreductase system protein [Citrobacter sp. Cb011]MDM3420459.1 YdhW family putative oxidoreductase system protein [Citrobacter sp. Cb025]MDM3441567.1 YdhW family putative oxidoreductase system protein 